MTTHDITQPCREDFTHPEWQQGLTFLQYRLDTRWKVGGLVGIQLLQTATLEQKQNQLIIVLWKKRPWKINWRTMVRAATR